MHDARIRASISSLHRRLLQVHDIDVWHWRRDTPTLDICAGAILVQHTAWANVERAVANLRREGALSVEALSGLRESALAALVRPAGLPLTKARRLKAFAALASDAGGLDALLSRQPEDLRRRLLATPGIGPETADVITLYAARRPVAVHDAYTARLYRRLGLGPERNSYEAWRSWLDDAWPDGLDFRWRHHAAIVLHCKEVCRTRPRCQVCPLIQTCPFGRGEPVRTGPIELTD